MKLEKTFLSTINTFNYPDVKISPLVFIICYAQSFKTKYAHFTVLNYQSSNALTLAVYAIAKEW